METATATEVTAPVETAQAESAAGGNDFFNTIEAAFNAAGVEDPAPADAAALAARFPGWSFRRDCKADLWVGLRTARGLQTRVGAQTAPLLHRKLARHP